MKKWTQENRQEAVIYGILWGAVFCIVPLVMLFRSLSGGSAFRLGDMLEIWLGILPFLVLFLLHDAAAPLLVEKRNPFAYLAALMALLLLFGVYIWASRKTPGWADGFPGGPPPMAQFEERQPPMPFEGGRPLPPKDFGLPMAPEVMKLVMGLLVVGVNLGVKYYLKAARSERRMQELKAENLGQQLETLRYQINPHFFMNTLNNIHALVDIDPEQAKAGIEEFSKLMRYVLYEGNRPTIPLMKEIEYLRHYAALMRMRYADSVRIELALPESADGAEVPPLMLASFVENAFKHGISYEKPSFVRVAVDVSGGKIAFKCVNSRQGAEQVRSHGIGLSNVRKRLDLLYGDSYTLYIDENAEVYDILLVLPQAAGLAREDGA